MRIRVCHYHDYIVQFDIFLTLLKLSTNQQTGHIYFSPVSYYRAMNNNKLPQEIEGNILGGCTYNRLIFFKEDVKYQVEVNYVYVISNFTETSPCDTDISDRTLNK